MDSSLSGKICLVTGASSGIGKETARGLAKLRGTVVLACRNEALGEAARQDIVATTGNTEVGVMLVDFSSQQSIRLFADKFEKKHSRLHILINNAGFVTSKRIVTVDGIESTFAVNHLGYFLLTNLLLDLMRTSAPARIINVTSEAQKGGRIDFDDLQGEKHFSGMRAYSNTKLANVLFTYELARRLEGTGVTVNCVHPGAVRTNFGRKSGGFMSVAVRVFAPFMRSPEKGAETPIYLAASEDVEGVTGKYFSDKTETRSTSQSYDESVARRLWDESCKLTGLTA